MRKSALILLAALAIAGCGRTGVNRDRPDEFAVGRQAPLIVPPDYSLAPPQPGAPRPQDSGPAAQALDALFGGAAPRSPSETSTLGAAGRDRADAGVRSSAGDPQTNVVEKGSVTRDMIAAPEGDGQAARVVPGGQ
jgi:predicted small lipoprotein YifL